ncbi:MAG TPA: sigma-70 family RNA polymerase sigma factor [Bacteroidia bacterium]|nr:sigma-70 family RNA polymerase sigma factor [Bacteroidia bacterium]HNU32053.1 sigma-70 family RNA polymerase sigma factor [Bacteroidia bacterium]
MWLIRSKDKSTLTDAALIELYRSKNDTNAIGILFNRYSHLVYGVCMKYLKDDDDCKDATLQIFEKLYDDLKKYSVEKFSFWLHSVARNYCLMQLRNKQAALKKEEDFKYHIQQDVQETEPPLSIINNSDISSKLNDALATLNTEQRICVELFYLKKKCYQEIAELTNFDMKQVKSYIQNGKRNLKIYLEKHIHEQH